MIESTPFTPASAALGGALIGLAAALLMLAIGRIAGISGILRSALSAADAERSWKLAFLFGLVVSAGAAYHVAGFDFAPRIGFPAWKLLVGGLLVGIGTALGSGCTSGHGVCGIARFSRRSLLATLTFMAFGIASAILTRHVIGGAA